MIRRRDAIKSLTLAPLLATAPTNVFAEQLRAIPTALFVYDTQLSDARSLAREAQKLGHELHPIESNESGFWRSSDKFDLHGPLTIFGATTRRAYFVFEQLSRLHWSHRLNDARIIRDSDSFSFWTLQLQPNN